MTEKNRYAIVLAKKTPDSSIHSLKRSKFESIDLLHTQKMLLWPNFHQHCYQPDKNYNEFSDCLASDQPPKYGHEWMNEEFTSVTNFD